MASQVVPFKVPPAAADDPDTVSWVPSYLGEIVWNAPSPWLRSAHAGNYAVFQQPEDLAMEVRALRQEVHELGDAVRVLAERLVPARESGPREVTAEAAKKEVAEYLRRAGEAYPSDLSDVLNIDYELVCQALTELRSEGLVEMGGGEAEHDS